MSKKARTAWVAVPKADTANWYPYLFKTRRECMRSMVPLWGTKWFRPVRVTITPAKAKKGKSK